MAKCVGCGYCCTKAPCLIGKELHGDKIPCPELLFAQGRHWCRWVMAQELIGEGEGVTAAKALDIGAGCCSSLNTWRNEEMRDRREASDTSRISGSDVVQLFRLFTGL